MPISSDHLKTRNCLKNKMTDSYNTLYNTSETSTEDYTLYTNEGDIEGSDPSKTSYERGYKLQPYEMRYIANKGRKNKMKRLRRKAAVEITKIKFSPQDYAEEILSIWKEVDGPLQDYFDAFTSNGKVDNKTKKEICEILREKGFEVVPTLLDERPKYAAVGNELNDIQLSDISLNNMEDSLNGNRDPLTRANINRLTSTEKGYDEISQLNDDFGVMPHNYEIDSVKMSSRLLRKKKL